MPASQSFPSVKEILARLVAFDTVSRNPNRALMDWVAALLAEAGRVARPQARFALITHDIRLLEQTLANQTTWQPTERLKIRQGNIQPAIFVLERV